jgi:outer membrane protein
MLGSRLTISTLCAAAIFAVTPAFAQVKIAIIDTSKALAETTEIKKVEADMQVKFKPRQERLALLQKEMETLQGQLTTMAGKLTPQAQGQMENDLKRKQKDYTRLGEDLQADVEASRGDILNKAGSQMDAVVKAYATAHNIDVVIDVSNAMYFKPDLEITKQITEAYDKAHPAK